MGNQLNLLKLQFNSLLSLKKSLIMILCLSIVFGFIQPNMIVFVGAMFLMTAVYSVIFYEERSKMDYLIYSLPITINEYLLSKYIYGLINTVFAVIISTALSMVIKTFSPAIIPPLAVALTIAGMGIFFVSILLPATLLLGFEKGRFVLVFIAVIPMVFSTALVDLLPQIQLNLSTPVLTFIIILASAIILLASYFITCNRFAKRELS